MKKLAVLISTLLIASVGLVGCGTSSSKNTESNDLLSKIKSEGKLRIGTEGDLCTIYIP